jgi:nucleoside-diphosphate-sugar epimerase
MKSTGRIFITGATGSIGSRLAEHLSQAGWAVRALVRNPDRAAGLESLENIEIVQGDLTQPEGLRGCMAGCSLVYHLAAKLPGSDWASHRAVNAAGTEALVSEAVHSGVERFVHVSTIGVYGLLEGENITEEAAWPTSNHPYFTTKQEAERLVWAATGTLPITIARAGDVVGPGQVTWTVEFIRKIKQGALQPPTDSDSGIMNPVYIDNLIDALVLMGTHAAAPGQAFNIVDRTPMRFSDYIRRLARMAGKRTFALPGFVLKTAASLIMAMDLLRGREASAKPADVAYLLRKATISGEKIRSLLGWKPAVDLEEAFRRTEEWLRREGLLSSM